MPPSGLWNLIYLLIALIVIFVLLRAFLGVI
jgi:hypothetical protein